ncbi:MAG: hypothetical protein IPJ30_22770 [Acidobacteria bacterium]|nr:hypothetical protein [Acidobacteriota bacterium]MBK8147827.1 hypothetical protein [Acidobacteriota bacterium]
MELSRLSGRRLALELSDFADDSTGATTNTVANKRKTNTEPTILFVMLFENSFIIIPPKTVFCDTVSHRPQAIGRVQNETARVISRNEIIPEIGTSIGIFFPSLIET